MSGVLVVASEADDVAPGIGGVRSTNSRQLLAEASFKKDAEVDEDELIADDEVVDFC